MNSQFVWILIFHKSVFGIFLSLLLGIEEVWVVEEENSKRISVSRFGGAGLPNCFGLGRWFIIQCGVLIV